MTTDDPSLTTEHPWDQQEGEPGKPYASFRQYLDAGIGRSIRKIAERDDRIAGISMMAKWSRRHDWVSRALAYDAHLAREELIEQAEKVQSMRKGHAIVGQMMLDKAARKIQSINPEKLTVREAAILAELGAKLERQARGEPDTTVQVQEGTNVRGPALTSGALWTMLSANPHLADAAAALDKALAETNGERAPESGGELPPAASGPDKHDDAEPVDAVLVDEAEAS